MDSKIIVTCIIVGVFVICLVLIFVITSIIERNKRIVSTTSDAIKDIKTLNDSCNFYVVEKIYNYYPELKSKRGLENFDIEKYIIETVWDEQNKYKQRFKLIEYNSEKYNEYLDAYNQKAIQTSEDVFVKKAIKKISYKSYCKIEKEMLLALKLPEPIVKFFVYCNASYTSPTGRNHYEKDKYYTNVEIKNFIAKQEKIEEEKIKEQELKRQQQNEKREKEKRLKELDKIEKRLNEKEKQIKDAEEEFLIATQGHIYTTGKNIIEVVTTKPDLSTMTITQKLNYLKAQFECGEITFEEYQTKRKELL